MEKSRFIGRNYHTGNIATEEEAKKIIVFLKEQYYIKIVEE